MFDSSGGSGKSSDLVTELSRFATLLLAAAMHSSDWLKRKQTSDWLGQFLVEKNAFRKMRKNGVSGLKNISLEKVIHV